MGRAQPDFDPDGPPDAVRWALERMLTRSLVEEDSLGRIMPVAAERVSLSSDRLTCTFRLRPGLRFTDGGPCTSRDFRDALIGGLARTDHATRAWLLAAVKGVDAVRAGRPLPPIGIETPDSRTLILRLVRPDSLLLRKLALPGVTSPWHSRARAKSWASAEGLGPYHIVKDGPGGHWIVARARGAASWAGGTSPESVVVRFALTASRVRALERAGSVELVWPLPSGMSSQPVGPLYHLASGGHDRLLMLVMRADVPPMTKLAARHALAHAINRNELEAATTLHADLGPWLVGAPPFDFPKLDAGEVAAWLDRGKLGRSFHVTLAYDPDAEVSGVARLLQGATARLNLYIELKPMRGSAMADEALRGTTQLILAESQPLLDRPEAQLAELVMPLRGPAVGAFRTGWRTREFDPWIAPRRPAPSLNVARAQDRLGEELVTLPLARLVWHWHERRGGPLVRIHPHFGPDFVFGRSPLPPLHRSPY